MKPKVKVPLHQILVATKHEDKEFHVELTWLTTPRGRSSYIGALLVEDHTVAESHIADPYRGQALGRLMYLIALMELGYIETKYHSASEPAQKMWRYFADHLPHHTNFWRNALMVRYLPQGVEALLNGKKERTWL